MHHIALHISDAEVVRQKASGTLDFAPMSSWSARRARLLVLTSVCLSACGNDAPRNGGTPSASSTATATTTAPRVALAPIDVRLGDKRIPFTSLLVFSRGGRALHLMASTHGLICSDLKKTQGIQAEAGEVTLDLTLAPQLQPDGTEEWSVTRVGYNDITRQGSYGAVDPNRTNPDEKVALAMDAKLRMPGSDGDLTIVGDFDIQGCGVVPYSREALEREQKDMTVKVAGKSYPLRSATFEQSDPPKLRLSTEPHRCGSVAGTDLGLTITLGNKENKAEHLRMEGFVLPTTLATKLVDVAAIPRDPVDGAKTLAIELQGETKIGAYSVELNGVASADVCPEETP